MAAAALCASLHLQGSSVPSALLHRLPCQNSSTYHYSQLQHSYFKSIGFLSALNYRSSNRDDDSSSVCSVGSSDHSSIGSESQLPTRKKYQNKETQNATDFSMDIQNGSRGGMTHMSRKVVQGRNSEESQLNKMMLKACEERDLERAFNLLEDIVKKGSVSRAIWILHFGS
ncbi:hypothetical protein SUGI_0815440 [Cryptomeria japonica]|nr:hypothetical protein SUGI_0815440 [Cryptomeria japonica]